MDLSKCKIFIVRKSDIQVILIVVLSVLISVYLSGCSDNVHLPTEQQLMEFNNAGPVPPSVDMDRVVRAKIDPGSYRVVAGDALELTMPSIVRFITAKEIGVDNTITPYISRVNDDGKIKLPIVGDIEAAGRTLPEIESDIIDAYYPKHVVTRPSVFARVLEYKTYKVSVSGAVMTPGIYPLRSDQMSLVALLMEAGGIIDEGAALIRIIHSDQAVSNYEDAIIKTADQSSGPKDNPNITLPLKPASDQIITSEDTIPPFFMTAYSSSAIGALAIKQDEVRPPNESADITNNTQKPLLVDRLTQNEQMVSAVVDEGKLFQPVEPVRYNQPNSNLDNTGAVAMANSNLESDMHILQLDENSQDAFSPKLTIDTARNRNLIPQRTAETGEPQTSGSVILPVKGFNIPFTDIALKKGDTVIVERFEPPLFTVVGLVNSPGNFPYPPDVNYTLMQAIGFGGGLNLVTEPRYVTVYRLKRNGTCIHAIFPIRSTKLADASSTFIKPGDIIAVEHTPRTRTALFLDRAFRINIGTYWRLEDNSN